MEEMTDCRIDYFYAQRLALAVINKAYEDVLAVDELLKKRVKWRGKTNLTQRVVNGGSAICFFFNDDPSYVEHRALLFLLADIDEQVVTKTIAKRFRQAYKAFAL